MILPPTVIARRALRSRMATLNSTGNDYDTVFRPTLGSKFKPQSPVETFLMVEGIDGGDNDVTSAYDEYLAVGIGVFCSTSLANSDVEIEDVVLMVLHSIKEFLKADPRQGAPGIVINTLVGDAEIRDSLHAGYYGGSLSVRLQVRNRGSDTF